jgi:dTDP-glucose 4,6-dehydratase
MVHYNCESRCGWLDYSDLKNEMEVVPGDIRELDSVTSAVKGVDIVFHLAALIAIPYSYESPSSYVSTNIVGTLNVLQASRICGVARVIHTSTSEVYGTARQVPIFEDHPLQGQSPYSATKIGADKLAESFNLSFGLPVSIVRPFNTYGPRQSARAIIPAILTQALANQSIRIGNLTPTRDFCYVEDTVRGFMLNAASEKAIGKVINLGTGTDISIRDLVKTICTLVGVDCPIVQEEERVRPAGSEVERLCAGNRMAEELLGWNPQVSLGQGLQRTLEWIRTNLGSYRVGVYAL